MFERFTDRARHAFVAASDEARDLGHRHVCSGHLLLGLLHDHGSDAGRILDSLGVTLDAARERVRLNADDERPDWEQRADDEVVAPRDAVEFSARSREVVERSLREALRLGGTRIATGHLVLGLLDVRAGTGAHVLTDLGVDLADARRRAMEVVARHAEADERAPAAPIVVPELSPQARRALQTALQLGSAYLGRRYAPVRMLRRASGAGGTLRRVASGLGPATPGRDGPALEAGPDVRPVPATCSSCGTPSPTCGTLYTTARGVLVCERCVDRES